MILVACDDPGYRCRANQATYGYLWLLETKGVERSLVSAPAITRTVLNREEVFLMMVVLMLLLGDPGYRFRANQAT